MKIGYTYFHSSPRNGLLALQACAHSSLGLTTQDRTNTLSLTDTAVTASANVTTNASANATTIATAMRI